MADSMRAETCNKLEFDRIHKSDATQLEPRRLKLVLSYRMRTIITRGLYIFYPLFEGQKRFFKEVFSENSAFMYGQMVSIQEQFVIKSGL